MLLVVICLTAGGASTQGLVRGEGLEYEVQSTLCWQGDDTPPLMQDLSSYFKQPDAKEKHFQTWFLEKRDLVLRQKQLTLRIRWYPASGKSEMVAKLSMPNPVKFLNDWTGPSLDCEWNYYPGPRLGGQCSVKKKKVLERSPTEYSAEELWSLLTPAQLTLIAKAIGPLPSDEKFLLLGPVESLKSEGAMELDVWKLGSTLEVEISKKTFSEAAAELANLLQGIAGTNYQPCEVQVGRTGRALDFLLNQP